MKTIEIRIPELGKAVGTTSWTAEKLDHITKTLKAGTNKAGEPCLSYEHWSDKDKDGKPKRHILCFICRNDMDENVGWQYIGNGVYSVYPEIENDHQVCLFRVLSKKSREIVESFLIDLCDSFATEYNNS